MALGPRSQPWPRHQTRHSILKFGMLGMVANVFCLTMGQTEGHRRYLPTRKRWPCQRSQGVAGGYQSHAFCVLVASPAGPQGSVPLGSEMKRRTQRRRGRLSWGHRMRIRSPESRGAGRLSWRGGSSNTALGGLGLASATVDGWDEGACDTPRRL